jgi:hypothetical protein
MEIEGQQKTEKSADHEQIAVGEIDHGQNTVYHCVAKGYQSVNTAQLQSIENLLKNIRHILVINPFVMSSYKTDPAYMTGMNETFIRLW